MDPKILRFSR